MTRQDNPVLRGSASILAGRPAGRRVSRGGECGSGLIEYAFVFLILMTMLLGIADLGRALYAYHFVYNAAREDTRYAAVRGTSCTGLTDCGALPPALNSTFEQNVPLGIDATQVTATTSYLQANGPLICANPPTENAPGCTVQVQISYTFTFIFPFISSSSWTMKSTSQMVISQ